MAVNAAQQDNALSRRAGNASPAMRVPLWLRGPEWMRLVRLLVVAVAGELMPGQSQLDQSLPVVAVGGRRGPPHRGLGFVLWVVPGTHGPILADRIGQADGNSARMIAVWFFSSTGPTQTHL